MTLDAWIDRQYRYAASALQKSISRTDLVKERPGFGMSVRPAKGSIVASPVFGDWNPEPDYFFHWFRDSAVVIDALRVAFEDGAVGSEALTHLADFVRFSASLANVRWQTANATPDFIRYLRDPAELKAVRPDTVVADTRVNPDGMLDITRWARPQHDGPALRALALMRWSKHAPADLQGELSALIRADVEFTHRHWREPSFDIWEEECGLHYYTLRVSAAALEATRPGEAREILRQLDPAPELDIAVVLAAIHADSTHDPHAQGTLDQLTEYFAGHYPINRGRPAPALGRYPGDVYFGGGAWYVATLAAAELCYRLGQRDRGDAFLETVRALTPESCEMSEQFDQETGAQKSARHLAWSYAAFITCIAQRRRR